VLQFNRSAISDVMGEAANYLGIPGGFDGFCAYVDDLNASLGVPKNLSGLGIENLDVERIVAGALIDPSTGGNPIEMTKENTLKLLLEIV
jgi:alcohol dehydrogenase class IV